MKRLFILCLILPLAAEASWPVIDIANVKQNVRQYVQMGLAYERQYQELVQAIEQVEALTGHYGAGELLNTAASRDARRYTPTSWQDTLDILEAGGLPGSVEDVRAYYRTEERATAIIDAGAYNRLNNEAPNARAFERRRDTHYASLAIAEASFDATEERLANYEVLMAEIEATDNLKASSDLAARIASENGLTLADLVRLQSVALQQHGVIEAQQLVDETNMKRQTRFADYRFGELPTNQEPE